MNDNPAILIVDDHELNRQLLDRWLKRQDFRTLEADNGRKALEIIKQEKICLLLLDIMMPEMNGYQVLEVLKSDPKLRKIPVIVISAVDDIDSVVRCIELGAEDYLTKPFNGVILKARINALLEKIRLQEMEEMLNTRITAMRKLADLGTMASGVAHELNSPLQVILGACGGINRRIESNSINLDELKAKVETIQRNTLRCAEITNALRTYAQAPVINFVNANLDEIIKQLMENFYSDGSISSKINVILDLRTDQAIMRCDPKYLSMAIANIIRNAIDSMPDGGILNITSNFVHQSEEFILSISDSGHGIPDDIRQRIFDPFFTTKPVGKGTGLGLSKTLGILRAHGGKIDFSSSERGTTFIIHLPATPPPDQNVTPDWAGGRYDDTSLLADKNQPGLS